MANGHDNSSAHRQNLLAPVMVLLFMGSIGLAWWYSADVAHTEARAGAAVVAEVRRLGIGSYVHAHSAVIRWFRTTRLVRKEGVTDTGLHVVGQHKEIIAWRATLMVRYPDGAYGGVEAMLEKAGRAVYEGHWRRWQLSDDMTDGKIYAGPLTLKADTLEMTGGLLAEITPDEIVLHHRRQSVTVERVPVNDNFLPMAAVPMALSVVHDRRTSGLFEVLELDLDVDDWPMHLSEVMLSGASIKEAPPTVRHRVAAAASIFAPAKGIYLADVYLDAHSGVLAVDQGNVEELFVADHLGIARVGLALAGMLPPENVRVAFRAVVSRSGLLEGLPPAEAPGE